MNLSSENSGFHGSRLLIGRVRKRPKGKIDLYPGIFPWH